MNTNNSMQAVMLLLDSSRGIYIPQAFAQSFVMEDWHVSDNRRDCLLAGPDDEQDLYWDVWSSVLDNAYYEKDGKTWVLHQDGDLWAYCLELMTRQEKRDFLGDDESPYQFQELDDKAKEKARDWFRECSTNDEWWDSVYEDSERVADILGISLDHKRKDTPSIYFSGFSSQGDGASFEGSYRYAKGAVKAIKAYAPQDTELQRIAKALQDVQRRNLYRLEATCKQSGHYQHSGCMSVDVEDSENRYRDISDAEGDIRQLMRDFADWIYYQLEKEHDYLNSDEAVDESIIANEYEFNEDGTIS